MDKTYLSPEQTKQVRALLRSLIKAGRIEGRRTYYDYYDSCHPPVETPDAPFKPVEHESTKSNRDAIVLYDRDLKAGGLLITLKADGIWRLSSSYLTYEVRIKGA